MAEPSRADELITARLRDALALVDIRVIDHLIVGDGACVSLAERGLLATPENPSRPARRIPRSGIRRRAV